METKTFNTRSWVTFSNGQTKLFNNSTDARSYGEIVSFEPFIISGSAPIRSVSVEQMMEDFELGRSMGDPSPSPNNF